MSRQDEHAQPDDGRVTSRRRLLVAGAKLAFVTPAVLAALPATGVAAKQGADGRHGGKPDVASTPSSPSSHSEASAPSERQQDDRRRRMRFKTRLTGAAEVNGGDLDGRGRATVVLFPDTGMVCFRIQVKGIGTVNASHIHFAAAGVNGGIVVPLTTTPFDKKARACVAAPADLVHAIIADPANYYVNVHTTDFPGGALRGQLG